MQYQLVLMALGRDVPFILKIKVKSNSYVNFCSVYSAESEKWTPLVPIWGKGEKNTFVLYLNLNTLSLWKRAHHSLLHYCILLNQFHTSMITTRVLEIFEFEKHKVGTI